MLETTLKLNEQIDELKKSIFKQIDVDAIKTIDEEEFKMLKEMLIIMDTSQELMVKQAELIEGIYKKLDELTMKNMMKGIER